MDDDVRARLGHRELDVRQRLVVDVEDLAEPADGVAHHRDVLGARGQGDLQIGRFCLHSMRVGDLGHPADHCGTRPRFVGLSLINAPLRSAGAPLRYRPAENTEPVTGRFPTLLERTPYNKKRKDYAAKADFFVKRGYALAIQDCRGRFKSEGEFYIYADEAPDGYDTVEWAAKLPRSTGKVGTFGMSYDAFLQWRLAPLRPSSLKCMSAYMGGAASLTDAEGPAGIRPVIEPQYWARWAADMRRRENMPGVHTVWEAQKLWEEDSEKWIYWLPWLELPGDFFGYETEADAAKHWLKNPHVDPWKLDEGIKEITVPNLDITGWYDHALHGDMPLFQTMAKEAKTELARKGSRVIIGPWSHAPPARYFGNIDFGPDALLDRIAMQIRWFDYWLKGKQNGAEKDASVRIFVMGDNQWRDEQHWPLRRTKKRILFITSDGHANTPRGDGKLVIERPESSNTDKYVYDPQDYQ